VVVKGVHQDLPIFALTNKNERPIALDRDRLSVLALKSLTPFSICRNIISPTYNAKGICLGDIVFGVPVLEYLRQSFLDSLPTVNRTLGRHLNRILRVERGQGGGIVVIPRIGNFFADRDKLLA